VGWKYDKNTAAYISPHGLRFESSKEALQVLDLLAVKSGWLQMEDLHHDPLQDLRTLEEVYYYWQRRHAVIHDAAAVMEEGEEDSTSCNNNLGWEEWLDKLQKTRDELVEAIFYYHLEDISKEFNDTPLDADTTIKPRLPQPPSLFTLHSTEQKDVRQSNMEKETSSPVYSRSRSMTGIEHVKRATSMDTGAEQYFTKKTQRMKRRMMTQEEHHTDESSHHSLTFEKPIHLLDPHECILGLQRDPVQMNEWNEVCTKREKELYHSQFDEWSFLLSTHHSILLYGFGSKRILLQSFVDEELYKHGHVLSLEGYDKDISLNGILNLLVQCFLNGVEPTQTIESTIHHHHHHQQQPTHDQDYENHNTSSLFLSARAISISQALANQPQPCIPIYLVIHNMDGLSLRDSNVQHALSLLVSCSEVTSSKTIIQGQEKGVNQDLRLEPPRRIRVIASIDHLNTSATLWNTETEMNFRWVRLELHFIITKKKCFFFILFSILFYLLSYICVMDYIDLETCSYTSTLQ